MVRKLADVTDQDIEAQIADLRECNRRQAETIERNQVRFEIVQEERDTARTALKDAQNIVARMEETRVIHDRRVSHALAENGASLERAWDRSAVMERDVEALMRENSLLAKRNDELRAEVIALQGAQAADPYRSVAPEIVEALRKERDGLAERLATVERAAKAETERARQAIATDVIERSGLRTMVAHLRRELNALARAAGVFRQHVAATVPNPPFLSINYDKIDKAISDGLGAADGQLPPSVAADWADARE